jgi:hypothetical protein
VISFAGALRAIALADALVKHNHDVINALKAWEPAQLAYGNQLLQYGQMLGVRVACARLRLASLTRDRSQFSYGTGREA